ncbi:hypothetical protein MPSEU_000037400 [Mayamaea pseudoterrestris]|nr:hypothetical protein MPSEU_000037400 [Mayamaea pseudoterrestris]
MALLSAALVLLLSRTSTRRIISPSRLFSVTSLKVSYNEKNLISSTKSNTVRIFQSLLAKRQKRQELEATVVEGSKMIFDLLRNPETRDLVQHILVSTDDWNDYVPILDKLIHSHEEYGKTTQAPIVPLISPATASVVRACSDVITNQGIVAKVSIPKPQISLRQHNYPFYVIADGLQDPGNVGTLLRSCAAAGAAGFIVLPNTCDPWSPKAVRSAMGTSFQLPIMQASGWEECCELLEQCNCRRVLAATMLVNNDEDNEGKLTQQSTCYFDIDFTSEPVAIVLGSEGSGLSNEIYKELLASPDSVGKDGELRMEAVHIPMQTGVESLNAAVCGSLMLYEYVRQRTIKEK